MKSVSIPIKNITIEVLEPYLTDLVQNYMSVEIGQLSLVLCILVLVVLKYFHKLYLLYKS